MTKQEIIAAAVAKLDQRMDEHWNEDGTVSIKALRGIAKDNSITSDEVKEFFPELKREDDNAGTSGDDAAAQVDDAKAEAEAIIAAAKEEAAKIKTEAAQSAKTISGKAKEKVKKSITPGKEFKGYVVALEKGHYGSKIRVLGDVFSFEGIMGSWMREATKEEIAAATKAGEA
jgi:regulator of protease activity HflC (stomatin/prohibitin superfamily)